MIEFAFMDDLSVKATKIVIEYCLEILEEAEAKIHGKPSLARLEAALNQQYAEQYENKPTSINGQCTIPS
jgi:hypothetical protein